MRTDILVVDDEPDIRGLIGDILEDEGHGVRMAWDSDTTFAAINASPPDLIILDIWLKDSRLDAIALSAAELGIIFTTAVLITGPLWGKIAWGAWWVWEPRLTLTLLLWLIYVAYFMLRNAPEAPEKGKRFAAVLGIIGAIDIPLIHMSVQWFRSQHPQAVVARPDGPTADPEIVQTLLVSFLAFTIAFFALLLYRYGLERMEGQVEALRYRAAMSSPSNPAEGVLQ